MYIPGVETKFNRKERNVDGGEVNSEDGLIVFSKNVRPFGASKYDVLSEKEFEMIQWYVLNNSEEVEPFLSEHKRELEQESLLFLEERHKRLFFKWFKEHIILLRNQGVDISNDLYALAYGPDRRARRFTGCIVNGVRFHTKTRDTYLKTQNSGVSVEGNHDDEDIDFFGVLTDIIQLDYIRDCQVVMFRCDWFDLDAKKKRMHRDGHLISINVNKCWYENDPFILANQANQVFYLNDIKQGKDWRVVQKFNHRHLYDIPEVNEPEVDETEDASSSTRVYQELEIPESDRFLQVEDIEEEGQLFRDDMEANIIDAATVEVIEESREVTNVEDDVDEDETLIEYCSEDERDTSDLDVDSDLD